METTRIIRGSTQELQTIYRMKNEPIISTGGSSIPNPQPKTTERYREAVELYRSTRLSCCEISRTCSVSLSGLKGHICKYHRHLMLARYDISCDKEEAGTIRLGQLRGQQPATRAEYKEAVEACSSMDYIEYNVSQIARDILPKNNYSIDALQLLFAAFSSFFFLCFRRNGVME